MFQSTTQRFHWMIRKTTSFIVLPKEMMHSIQAMGGSFFFCQSYLVACSSREGNMGGGGKAADFR